MLKESIILLEILEHILDLYLVQKKYFMDAHYIY